MFLEKFISNDATAAETALVGFLGGLGIKREFVCQEGSRELPTGVPSRFLDIFPKGVVQKHETFGIVFVRLWIVGLDPKRLVLGIYLGAAPAQQSEPRRAAQYVRKRLENLIDPLERERGFKYQTWGDSDIWWASDAPGSVRAVTRQFEQFITYRTTSLEPAEFDKIEEDVGELVKTVDAAIDELEPIREFGKDILLIYYGENLPAAPVSDAFVDPLHGTDAPGPSAPEKDLEPDWFGNLPELPQLGDLRGMREPYEKVVAALAAGKHVLLMGAPGVGKTELAEAVCRTISQPYDVVTATSDWTSNHTIGGYMPVPLADSNAEPLDFIPGVFTEAMVNNKWLIIDEMNRADIDKAFGEMFTLLGGKRKSIRLPYLKRQDDGTYRRVVLGMPNSQQTEAQVYGLDLSWRFIGTMNTFDKASLFQMSLALSRRVAVIDVPIPNEVDYQAILKTEASVLQEENNQDLYDSVLAPLVAMFAAEGGTSLGSLGLRVGPAIPLDMIRFIDRMRRFEVDPVKLVLAALESYLFPQFEGKHEQTSEIAGALAAGLGLKELPVMSVERLRTFTGSMD